MGLVCAWLLGAVFSAPGSMPDGWEIGGDPVDAWIGSTFGPVGSSLLDPPTRFSDSDIPAFMVLESLPDPEKQDKESKSGHREGLSLELGVMAGYIKARGADHGTWFVGGQARLYILPWLGVEGSVTYHLFTFNNGNTEVEQIPVQVTGLIFPFPSWPLQPYVLGGAGWYYSITSNEGPLASVGDQTTHTFGAHVGAGLELVPAQSLTLFADFRYIFLKPTIDTVMNGDFNSWQVALGIGIAF
jgi:hypothetical protein